MFENNSVHSKFMLEEFGDCEWFDLMHVFQIQHGKTTQIKPEYTYEDENHPIVICKIPDGDYCVEGAFYENGKPCVIKVRNSSFDSKEMAMAGAYLCWCKQSNNPTGHTTLHLDTDEDNSYYHEGLCGELYHCHNCASRIGFNLDKKTVALETAMCR